MVEQVPPQRCAARPLQLALSSFNSLCCAVKCAQGGCRRKGALDAGRSDGYWRHARARAAAACREYGETAKMSCK